VKNLPDTELFEQVQQDREQAFEVLMHRYSSQLYDVVYKRLGSDEETKDILQDIFIGVWKNRRQIQVTDSLYPYIYRAAKNAVIDQLIARQKKVSYEDIPEGSLYSTLSGAEDKFNILELQQQFRTAINNMPATMRQVFLLSRDEQLTAREIASRLNISEQTVRNNISMALQRLRNDFRYSQLLVLLPSSLFFGSLVTLA